MDLDLQINGTCFRLGELRDDGRLREAGFRRLNLWRRLSAGKLGGHREYQAENCTVACFGDAFELYPCTDAYLNHDRRWNTEAVLVFVQDRLTEIRFAVIDGRYAAPTFWERFRDAGISPFGKPEATNRFSYVWNSAGGTLQGALSIDRVNCHFRWVRTHHQR